MLSSCIGITERENKTIYVANDYVIYQNQKKQNIKELISLFNCDQSIDIYISPLVNTKPEKLSQAIADFMKLCGQPKKITLSIDSENN